MKNNIKTSFWKNKKVFVTGHTGFKGSWLCILLNMLGAEVTGYSLKPKTKPNLYNLAFVKSILKKSIIADINNYEKLLREIKKSNAEIIFHLAAQPLVRYSYINPKETFDTNITGSLNVLESVRKIKKIKAAVLITSDKVYDNKVNKIFKESDQLGGSDPYSSSKVCIEFLFSSYVNSFFINNSKQKIATARAGNVIGGGDYSEDRLIPDIFKSSKKFNHVSIRNRKSTRPWQHVLEPLTGYLILAERLFNNRLKNIKQNWNFGPDLVSCKSVEYIATKLAKSLKLRIVFKKNKRKNYKKETNLLRLDNNKSKKILRWFPKWTLDESLDKILEWNKDIKKFSPLIVTKRQINEFLNL